MLKRIEHTKPLGKIEKKQVCRKIGKSVYVPAFVLPSAERVLVRLKNKKEIKKACSKVI